MFYSPVIKLNNKSKVANEEIYVVFALCTGVYCLNGMFVIVSI